MRAYEHEHPPSPPQPHTAAPAPPRAARPRPRHRYFDKMKFSLLSLFAVVAVRGSSARGRPSASPVPALARRLIKPCLLFFPHAATNFSNRSAAAHPTPFPPPPRPTRPR